MRRSFVSACLATGVALVAHGALADVASTPPDPPHHAVEVGVAGIFERMTTSAGNTAGTISSRRGGNAVALSITYRTRYFLAPFIDVAYYPLYASTRVADLGSAGGPATAVGTLAAVGFIAGPALDFLRFRLRVGVGTYDVMVHSSVLGRTIHAAESDMGYLVALDGYVLETRRFRVGLEVRAAFVVEADVTALGVGLTFAGDAIQF